MEADTLGARAVANGRIIHQPPLPGLAPQEGGVAARQAQRTRVLIVGAGARGRDVAEKLMTDARTEVDIVGFVDDRTDFRGLNGLPILGGFDDVIKVADANGVSQLVIAYTPSWHEDLVRRMLDRDTRDRLYIKVLPGFYDTMLGEGHIECLSDIPLVTLNGEGPSRCCLLMKRLADVVFSLLMLVLSLPVIACAAAAVKVTSRGPIIYRQQRVGQRGRVFDILKLRTMVAGAERQTGPVLTQKHDKRVTRVGRVLRQTRLDEFPQFWNVLRGEMSVVGPRPERPALVREFESRVPGYLQRLRIRPGITGMAQVNGYYFTSVYHKLRHDWLYINRMSFWTDASILVRTVVKVLSRAGN
jgi:exopolysaccharide biosynthesis polyprenyl glycosylphosphotransferase